MSRNPPGGTPDRKSRGIEKWTHAEYVEDKIAGVKLNPDREHCGIEIAATGTCLGAILGRYLNLLCFKVLCVEVCSRNARIHRVLNRLANYQLLEAKRSTIERVSSSSRGRAQSYLTTILQLRRRSELSKPMANQYWVGVRKDRVQNHDVFELPQTEQPEQESHGQYEYVIGPFAEKLAAEKRARTEKNLTNTFTDPFCNGGQGR